MSVALNRHRFMLAVVACVVAVGVTLLFRNRLDRTSPLLVFYAAVAVSSWYGGFWPGVGATILGLIAAQAVMLVDAPFHEAMSQTVFGRLLLFFLVGVLISFLNGRLHTAAQAQQRTDEELRDHEARLRELVSEQLRAEESERRRIAVLLHDGVSATLALAKRRLESLRHDSAAGLDDAVLGKVVELLTDAIQRTRSLTSELSPSVLYELGLTPALRWLSDQFDGLHGLPCEVKDDGQLKPLSNATQVVLFQAVRELLVNSVKHAKPHLCGIIVRREGESIVVEVRDDGKGFDVDILRRKAAECAGFGLFNIRERLTHLGGRLDIRSAIGKGTIVSLTAPLRLQCPVTPPSNSKGVSYEYQNSVGG